MDNTISIINGAAHYDPNDHWQLVLDDEVIPEGINAVVSWVRWQQCASDRARAKNYYGVVLAPDDDPAILVNELAKIPLIALQFPSFRDGRAYSQATVLRTRYHFQGDLRAVGDVLRDQLSLMRHCGFSSFKVREDKPVCDALKGLEVFDKIYARSVTHPQPRFRRSATGDN
ncbi:DUF934 domain-containing protein [Marinagarivorans cellulosilyticus]|uniref:Oxidoreductase n=1 Tax=Marinagarivorans cellulosilyticus TaxID=2721545 RepID=A0AAN1WE14_9GAMM|nr:DUF934 domain-containing protein [Marinagarivorans cellulosilyticus]BCD95871.1 hypothetical protein MARGE09_P0070 [Marinagarivorans cellulosilyticus]